jgi:hypothetical protein
MFDQAVQASALLRIAARVNLIFFKQVIVLAYVYDLREMNCSHASEPR